MAHLVIPITGSVEVEDAIAELQEAHDFLAEAAIVAGRRLAALPAATWGQQAKRTYVELPESGRPSLLKASPSHHALTEITNQCATMERLIDALRWGSDNLPDHVLHVCHPTTSSNPEDQTVNNDIVLMGPEGAPCRFEVSDVASSKDGNQKERKDLKGLSIFTSLDPLTYAPDWPDGRAFLVVSEEFSEHLMRPTRHGLKEGRFHYRLVGSEDTTRIIEVCEGPPPGNDDG